MIAIPEVLIVGKNGFAGELRAVVERDLVGSAIASTWATARAKTVMEAVEIVPRRAMIDLVFLLAREEPIDEQFRKDCECLARAMQHHGKRPSFTFHDERLLPIKPVVKRNNVAVLRGPLWWLFGEHMRVMNS